jgi:hypothetical protein
MYETTAQIGRSEPTTSITVSSTTSSSLGVPGSSVGTTTTISTTTTQQGGVVTAEEPVGYYTMNDGSVYQINCITGEAIQVKSPT